MSSYQVCPIARLEKLLVPTDSSEFSESAIKEALTLAKACSSKIYALSVFEINPEFEALAPGFVERAKKTASEHLESSKEPRTYVRGFLTACNLRLSASGGTTSSPD